MSIYSYVQPIMSATLSTVLDTYCQIFGGFDFCSNFSWSAHCKHASAKASNSLNFLFHTFWGATTEAKSITYKYLVRPSRVCKCCVEPSHCLMIRQGHSGICSTTCSMMGMWELLVPFAESM